MGKTIGIDLGTTNSCVAVTEGGRTYVITNDKGGRTTPSVVAFTQNGERLVGEAALRQASINPENTVFSVKRRMGTNWEKRINGKVYSPQEISAMVLAKLKEEAEKYLAEPVTDAVITVPAYFDDIQRQATKDAGKIAGLNVKRIVNEPTAAALAYGLNNGEPRKVMVYDLGGGTFDVSIIEIGEGVVEVLSTNGDNHLGGDDFDKRIWEYFLDDIKKKYRVDLKKSPMAAQRLLEASVEVKINLSTMTETTVALPYLFEYMGSSVNYEAVMTRERFNRLIKDLIDRTEKPVMRALNDAGLACSEIDKVLLVGGSTRIPAIGDKVYSITGITPSKSINPDECVAQGAAILGEILEGNAISLSGNRKGLLLLDVTPMSLSVETVGGVATRLIERNSRLPVRYSRVFSTAASFQREVEINVLRGEHTMAKENRSIGKFTLTGIKRAPAGVPKIEVCFDIDTNGIVQVSAKDLDTGMSQSIVISDNEKMSDEEIERAMSEAKDFECAEKLRREAAETLSKAEMMLERVERDLEKSAGTVSDACRRQINEDCERLRKEMSRNDISHMTRVNIMDIRNSMQRLEKSSANICWNS